MSSQSIKEKVRVTPDTAPAGERLLVRPYGMPTEDLSEIAIIEWAPSGRAVKVRYISGIECWETSLIDEGVVIERLPPIAPAARRNIDEELDVAVTRIFEKYGPDLQAFFRDAYEEYQKGKSS